MTTVGTSVPLKTVGLLFWFILQFYFQGDNGALNNTEGNIFPVIRNSACAGVSVTARAGISGDVFRII
ncbi:hypothetical protein CQ955_005495 [Escherichia coli]|nr:hypothetical protein [Escherichia coli]